MPNNFSTLKLNQAVQKFTYIRFEPSRFLNDELVSIGGGKYTATISNLTITNIFENDTQLSLVTGTPLIGEYSYNNITGLLTIYPNSAPSSSNAIVLFQYLFFSSGGPSIIPMNPEDNNSELKFWEQRIKQSPSIEFSIKNILSGILTISGSTISLINNSFDLNYYFGPNYSWYRKKVEVWTCLDATENIQKVFKGVVTGASVAQQTVSINIEDLMSKFSAPALFNDSRSEVYISKSDYPNINGNNANSPIRLMFGTVTKYQTIPETVTGLVDAQKIEPTSLFDAVCVDYTTDLSTSNNRQWIACRTCDGYLDFSCTPSNIDNSNPNYTRMTLTSGQIAKFHIGDTFVMNGFYLRILFVDRVNNYIYTTKEAGVVTTNSIQSAIIPTVIVSNKRDEHYYLMYGRDYSVTETTTTGGNKLYKIVLANNFEANHAGLTVLNVGSHSVLFRMKPNTTNAKHGSVIKKILESLGLSVNSSSIITANTSLTSNVNFSIPQFDETDYNQYFKYIELILSSTFGYIFLNNSFEIEYKLFQAPSSINELSDRHVLDNSVTTTIDYKDIVTQLIAYNSHYSASEVVDMSATPSVTVISNKAKYLHDIDNTVRFRHVLEDMTTRLQLIMDYRAERNVIYNFETANVNIDSLIGDDFKLTCSGLLGGEVEKEVKIIRINKSNNKISISAIDLAGV